MQSPNLCTCREIKLNLTISKKKPPGFELAVLQCDGLLMNESAENGARDKKERTEAGRMWLAGMACVFAASIMKNFFI